MDELIALKAAVRDYCRIGHELDRLMLSRSVSEEEVEDKELALDRARGRMMMLAGVDELD